MLNAPTSVFFIFTLQPHVAACCASLPTNSQILFSKFCEFKIEENRGKKSGS